MPNDKKPLCPYCDSAMIHLDFTACGDDKYEIFMQCQGCQEESPAQRVDSSALGEMLNHGSDTVQRLMLQWQKEL